jgi:hypothetical protein
MGLLAMGISILRKDACARLFVRGQYCQHKTKLGNDNAEYTMKQREA